MTRRTALITGAEQGLGESIGDLLADRGYFILTMPGPICREGKEAIEAFLGKMSHYPDVVINNFGINHLSWIGETLAEDEAILRLNVMTAYWVINHLVSCEMAPCRVVNIASQTYRVPQRTTALYCASKAALVQMGKVMARELAPKGWIINTLAPGKIEDTEMSQLTDAQVTDLRGWTKDYADFYALSNIPMGRFTSRAEVAEMVVEMLHMPNYVNGAVIEMMGGV